ncbi:helix-turn-helix transcriptional regulator [Solirubrobacter sp. CPCC 204708]|uniref:Helix-turn-helix domain-containing protein n=1 Tax=Solirubrobacter deserti TaxID=2282478 RepID=A0ABT4RSP3_9ACTN|nr:helix-turn-helix domain-containing protein [Solirubrobacter deserti]MBE2315928.1 helix-turn-helix transcriptional regulator [Solirubrobacter deserti]MDA0141608.1 helix-turn-helix domain-containing protein [Solirubrobacter deserti]
MAIEDRVRARLRQARFERGLSLAELAAQAGMTASTISRLETGARRLTLAQVERLADALQLPVEALLVGGEPEPARDGRTWWPVGPEGPDGPRVYRVVLPVEEPVRHQHEGHQWLHVLDGTVRVLVGASDRLLRAGEAAEFSTWEPHALVAVDAPAEVLIVFRP